METKGATAVIHFCGEPSNEVIKIVDKLLGLKVHEICGGGDKLLALSDQGTFDIIAALLLTSGDLKSVLYDAMSVDYLCVGKTHCVALRASGEIFSWGQGYAGELGHGIKHTQLENPSILRVSEKIKQIAVGDYHSCVIDVHGSAYAWGQNFDKQLGLYRKSSTVFHSGCSVEGVMMIPKFLPFSLGRHVDIVACGARFTAAITKDGLLWTWGAGESGQLGTGRCTAREEPMVCSCESISGVPSVMMAVACGNAHIVAASKDGELFSWGLNNKGQLGLGDITPRHTPALTAALGVVKVFASGHSSAAIGREGVLLTWGSNHRGRLLQESKDKYFVYPTVVSKLTEDVVSSFAFCDNCAAALVHTRLFEMIPDRCPQKSVSTLQLRGCGFFQSDRTIVKFMRLGHIGFQAPRSSVGTLISYGSITCKPPKFGDPGIYEVSVAINGNDFTADKVRILVYADPVLGSFSPLLLDMRQCDRPVQIVLKGTALDTLGEDVPFKVRFSIYGPATAELGDRFTEAPATLVPVDPEDAESGDPSRRQESETENEFDAHRDDADDDDGDEQSQGTEGATRERKLICNVNLSGIWNDPESEKESSSGPLTYCLLQAQLSLNENDRSKPSSSQLICHRFTPIEISPNFVNWEKGGKVKVHGVGFFSSKLFSIKASIIDVTSGSKTSVDCTFISSTVLQFDIPPINKFLRKTIELDDPRGILAAEVKFQCLPVGVGDDNPPSVPLHPGSVLFYYYNKPRVSVSPTAVRRSGGTKLKLHFKGSKGFPFLVPKIDVAFVQKVSVAVTPHLVAAQMVSVRESQGGDGPNRSGSSSPRMSVVTSEIGSFEDGQSETDGNSSVASGKIDLDNSFHSLMEQKTEFYDVICAVPSLALPEDVMKTLLADAIAAAAEAFPATPAPTVSPAQKTDPPPKTTEKGRKRPSLTPASPAQPTMAQVLPREVFVGVVLDGEEIPSEEYLTAISLFDRVLVKDSQPPKGGYMPGATATLNVDGLLACDGCVVRIRGTNEAFIDVDGSVACNEAGVGIITFTIPTSFSGIEAEVKSRISSFYVDISVDRKESFDRSDNVILPVKLH